MASGSCPFNFSSTDGTCFYSSRVKTASENIGPANFSATSTGVAKSAKASISRPGAVDRDHLALACLIRLRVFDWALGFFLVQERLLLTQDNVSKIKIAVGRDRACGFKCPGLCRIGRARSYPNLLRRINRLARLVFPGHVDHHSNKINSPAIACAFNLIRCLSGYRKIAGTSQIGSEHSSQIMRIIA